MLFNLKYFKSIFLKPYPSYLLFTLFDDIIIFL